MLLNRLYFAGECQWPKQEGSQESTIYDHGEIARVNYSIGIHATYASILVHGRRDRVRVAGWPTHHPV